MMYRMSPEMPVAIETGFVNQWKLFGAYLDAVAQNCADVTLETWAGKLGGAEEFTKGHCFSMAEALRID